MSEMKRCVQCGLLKEAEEFRPYTYSIEKGTGGRYRICRTCEKINARYHTLKKQVEATSGYSGASFDYTELHEIQELYAVLEARGLRTPTAAVKVKPLSDTASLLAFYAEAPTVVKPKVMIATKTTVDIPEELSIWLKAPFVEWEEKGLSPEFLQETIYESLKAKYRPQTGVDKERFIPVYDDTFKDVLNEILKRFDDYEEEYADPILNEEGSR